jgi:NAD(P)-dependent dehydrogenase (short-subunit alcohol dehydrogenase family)
MMRHGLNRFQSRPRPEAALPEPGHLCQRFGHSRPTKGRDVLLDDRVAVVSGVGPGMGRDLALTLAAAGADVVLAARSEAALDSMAAEVRRLGRRVVSVPTDITDRQQCDRLADAALDAFGHVDVLVNNAFTQEDMRTFAGFDPARWRAPIDVNVFGTLQVTQAMLAGLRASTSKSVVMISTLSTRLNNPVLGGYAASKRALETATRTLAVELGPAGIRVNCVAPGHIWGSSLAGYFAWQAEQRGVAPEVVYDEVAALNPLHHIQTSEEISRTVLFFASDLSRSITGQTLDVNCGRYFH